MNNENDQNNSGTSSAASKAENAATQAGKLLGKDLQSQDVTDAANQARADAERSMREASSAPGTTTGTPGTAGATGGSTAPAEEEFVGTGGVGSAEQMEALRQGHEAAGSEYRSNLNDPNIAT
jgi:hypothetical protein